MSKGSPSNSSLTGEVGDAQENENGEREQVIAQDIEIEIEEAISPEPGPSQVNNNVQKTSQMIPIALLRKNSGSVEDNCESGGGLMQIITGTNKVAPAVHGVESVTTVGAVLMLVPKKSEQLQQAQDQENNVVEEGESQGNTETSQPQVIKPTPSYDSYEEVCRICHDNPPKLELISPCLCKGSMSKVHRTCLERWLGESAKNSCEICGYEYNTVRKPKYKGCRSIFQWIRHPLSPSDTRNLFFDIACFFILTPLAAISSWLCVVGAQHYTFGDERRRRNKLHESSRFHESSWARNEFRAEATNATWTSVGLLSLTGTLLVAYSVWLFVAIKYHIQAWSDWQQRNFTVTIIPYEDGMMGRPPPPRERERERNRSQNSNNSDASSLLAMVGRSDNANNNPYNFFKSPNQSSRYGTVTRAGERSLFYSGRNSNYNLPPIFNRRQFLRNPPPGYTISETAMLYQALYGSESESFLNENIIALLADSSDNLGQDSSDFIVRSPHQAGTELHDQPDPQNNTVEFLSEETRDVMPRGGSANNLSDNNVKKIPEVHLSKSLSTLKAEGSSHDLGENNNRQHSRSIVIPIPVDDEEDVSSQNQIDHVIV